MKDVGESSNESGSSFNKMAREPQDGEAVPYHKAMDTKDKGQRS